MAAIVFRRAGSEWQVVAFGEVWLTTRDAELGGLSAAALHVRFLSEQRIDDAEDVSLGGGATEEELRVGYAHFDRIDLFERRTTQLEQLAPEALNE